MSYNNEDTDALVDNVFDKTNLNLVASDISAGDEGQVLTTLSGVAQWSTGGGGGGAPYVAPALINFNVTSGGFVGTPFPEPIPASFSKIGDIVFLSSNLLLSAITISSSSLTSSLTGSILFTNFNDPAVPSLDSSLFPLGFVSPFVPVRVSYPPSTDITISLASIQSTAGTNWLRISIPYSRPDTSSGVAIYFYDLRIQPAIAGGE